MPLTYEELSAAINNAPAGQAVRVFDELSGEYQTSEDMPADDSETVLGWLEERAILRDSKHQF